MSQQMPQTQGCIAISKAVHEEKKNSGCCIDIIAAVESFANSYSCI